VCPEAGSSLLLPQLLGYHRAAEALLLGEPFMAEAALEVGLVNRVVPPTECNAVAQAQAKEKAQRKPAGRSGDAVRAGCRNGEGAAGQPAGSRALSQPGKAEGTGIPGLADREEIRFADPISQARNENLLRKLAQAKSTAIR
jgi:enoyl-CoA hydratase/carnithine racemase